MDIKFFNVDVVSSMIGPSVHKLSGKKMLWSGTNGFIGTWVLRVIAYLNEKVLDKPCEFVAVDLSFPDPILVDRFKNSGITFIAKDLTKPFESDLSSFDYVVHMAGIASPAHYKRLPLETIGVALEGSKSLLEIARSSGARYLFCSSSEVYQTATVIPTPENYVGSIPSNNFRSCYDVSKLMGENYAYVYHTHFGLHTNTVRIFNSFGPGLPQSDYRILSRIASAALTKQVLQVFSSGTLPSRTYCPTANTVAGIFLTLLEGKAGQIYNIGVDSPELTVVDLLKRIEANCNLDIRYELMEPPVVYETEPMRRCPDITLAKTELGYDPVVSLDQGLKLFFGWALSSYKNTTSA
jgi:UDP-glucuronate decarboxylase